MRAAKPAVLLLFLCSAFLACTSGRPEHTPTPSSLAQPRVTTYVDGANFAVDIEFAPDGRLFYNELRTGLIRIVSAAGELQQEPFARLEVVNLPSYSEHGLLGLALDPHFAENGFVYAFYSAPDAEGIPLKQRLVRFTDVGGLARDETVILDDLPVGPTCCHNGGRLAFGPDGKLYVSIGDSERPESAQDTTALSGKVLRINADGSVPADNPLPGLPAWAWGLRNPFGLAFAADGSLYATENGPAGFDEINRIEKGGNYGWPEVGGIAADPRFLDPLHSAPDYRVVPTGITVYSGDDLDGFRGHLFFCSFNEGTLARAVPKDGGLELFDTGQPCALDVTSGPDGALYFSDLGTIYRWGR